MVGGNAPKGKKGVEYNEAVLVLGGRSGKSTMAHALACYEACCRDWSQFLQRPGELCWCFVLATKEKQAIDIGRNMIMNSIRSSPVLRDLIVTDVNQAQQSMFPRSRAGVLVLKTGIAICALPCSSRVGRGYPIAVAILDELAWFARDSKNDTTDQGVYDSILPRQAQFIDPGTKEIVAKMFLISTPSDHTGLLWEKYRDRQKNKDLYYCVRVPTHRMRTDWAPSIFDSFKKRSPQGYRREFGAEFAESKSPFLQRKDILRNVRKETIPPHIDTDKHVYFIGIDAAFGDNDRFGIAVAHAEETTIKNKYDEDEAAVEIVVDIAEILEERYDKDVIETSLERILELSELYQTFEVIGDDHGTAAFKKILEDRGIDLNAVNWTTALHRKLYGRLRSLLKRRLLSLPDSEDLIDELQGLEIKYMAASGQFTVGHRTAGHDDVSDAVALVVGELWEEEGDNAGVMML